MPSSTAELSNWYEVFDFAGNQLHHIKFNEDGGPCGTPHEAVAPH